MNEISANITESSIKGANEVFWIKTSYPISYILTLYQLGQCHQTFWTRHNFTFLGSFSIQ